MLAGTRRGVGRGGKGREVEEEEEEGKVDGFYFYKSLLGGMRKRESDLRADIQGYVWEIERREMEGVREGLEREGRIRVEGVKGIKVRRDERVSMEGKIREVKRENLELEVRQLRKRCDGEKC